MGDVIPFARSRRRRERAEGRSLCRNGFHRWAPEGETRFDVRKGRLVSVFRCQRCGLERRSLT